VLLLYFVCVLYSYCGVAFSFRVCSIFPWWCCIYLLHYLYSIRYLYSMYCLYSRCYLYFTCHLYSVILCSFKLLWCLNCPCPDFTPLCCRNLFYKAGVATAIILCRSRCRNRTVWVLRWEWLLLRTGCLVLDPQEWPCTSKLRDAIPRGPKSSALREHACTHAEAVDVYVPLYRV
jgi:hypothetical protein